MNTATPSSFEEVFRQFAEGIDIPDLEFDEDGNAELLCGEDLVLNIHYDSEISELLFYAEIADIDGAPRQEELLLNLLRANFFWMDTRGFTLGMAHDSCSIVLTGKESEETFSNADVLATYVNAMLETIYDVRRTIRQYFMEPLQELNPNVNLEEDDDEEDGTDNQE